MTERARGVLRIVATPIGNLADLSPRAAEALKTAELILCEDTRHSRPLLDRVGARARVLSCHAHNEAERLDDVVAALEAGRAVALITDAGAPGVSDPGGRIVEGVAGKGHAVEVFPGPSALVGALMGAGIDVGRFAFLGFLPRRGRARRALLDGASSAGLAIVVLEAPTRAEETLADLHEALGARRVVVARELTKLHETFHRGVLGAPLTPPLVEKGELVIAVEAAEAQSAPGEIDVAAVARDTALPPKERARRIAQATGMSVREAYALVAADVEDPLARAQRLLGEAAGLLVELDVAARVARGQPVPPPSAEKQSSGIAGADGLMALLARGPALRAPAEEIDAVRALLQVLERVDTLREALSWEREGRERPGG